MTDLIEFLRARLDDDERAAASAASVSDGTLDGRVGARWNVIEIDWEGIHVYSRPSGLDKEGGTAPITAHMQRYDPARVMAEVEAKRAILELHRPLDDMWCSACCDNVAPYELNATEYPCPTLRLLALPYADHRDYRQEWKP